MDLKSFAWVMIGWTTVIYNAEALSLSQLTDARRIEHADRIVIGTVEIKGDVTLIKVEEVLKGDVHPKRITTDRKPHSRLIRHGAKKNKVLWIERDDEFQHQPLKELAYIEEGSERWMIYHSLIDPTPLLKNDVFERSTDAAQVLGYLFEPVKITSSDAPMVADRLVSSRYVTEGIPWNYEGVLELKCRMVEGWPERMQVDSMSAEGEIEMLIRSFVEMTPLDHMEEPVPARFSLRIDVQKPKSVGSQSYENVTEYLRNRLGMLMDSPIYQGDGAEDERWMTEQLTRTAMISLKRMKDLDSVPRVIEIALQVSANHSTLPFDFLSTSRDPRAFEPACDLLAKHAAEYPESHWLSDGAARVLGAIGDPAALPYLEDAVRHGVANAHYPLGHMGDVETMAILIESTKNEGFEAHAHGPLYWLVKRSNRETEPWMEFKRIIRGERDDELRRQWLNWWEVNKVGMELVRSYEEASRGWVPAWRKEEVRRQAQTQITPPLLKHWWKYALGLALLMLVTHRLRNRFVPFPHKVTE